MSTSNSAAPPTLRPPTGLAGLAAAVVRIPVNLVRWIAVLARAPRAQLPPVGGTAFLVFAVVLAVIIASMFLFDTKTIEWARRAEQLGAGEILLTSMDCDGTRNGYDIELTRAVSDAVRIPVIASGGAGKVEHFYDALTAGGASAVLAASLFHFGELSIGDVKSHLRSRGLEVR